MTAILVDSTWLSNNLEDNELIILDASLKGKPTAAGLEKLQIKGTRYFDLKKEFSLQENKFPNMLASPAQFELACRTLGINRTSKIVVYDKQGIYTSPRAWWMFKIMGHENVAVLDGGLPDWIANGNPTEETKAARYELGNFEAKFNANLVKDFEFIRSNIDEQQALVIDARSAGRFNGTAPEPRKDLRSGCIPNSINIPYTEVLENGKYKSKSALLELFSTKIQSEKNLVFSCGSGITACILYLANELVQVHQKSIYDGSWTEWAQRIDA